MTNEKIEQHIIQISFWKAVSVISGAVLVTIVGTTFAVARVINSDHFLLARTVDDVSQLKERKLDANIYEIHQQQILDRFDRLETAIREMNRQSTAPQTRTVATRVVTEPVEPTSQPAPEPIIIEHRTEVREVPQEKEKKNNPPENNGQQQRETVLRRVLGIL